MDAWTLRLPLRLERPAVVILEAEGLVLIRVAVRDLEHAAPPRPRIRDPVRLLGRDDELVAGPRFDLPIPDLDAQALIDDHPHLVPELVVMLAGLLTGLDGDESHRRGLVQRVRHDLAPGLVHDHGGHSSFGNSSTSEAISIAAMAASQPLFPCFPPARSKSWSTSSVASTPKITGT